MGGPDAALLYPAWASSTAECIENVAEALALASALGRSTTLALYRSPADTVIDGEADRDSITDITARVESAQVNPSGGKWATFSPEKISQRMATLSIMYVKGGRLGLR